MPFFRLAWLKDQQKYTKILIQKNTDSQCLLELIFILSPDRDIFTAIYNISDRYK